MKNKFKNIAFLSTFLLATPLLTNCACAAKSDGKVAPAQPYADDDEGIVLNNPIDVYCDYSNRKDPALIKKIDMYNAGCIRPFDNYERDLGYWQQLAPQSLRIDASIGKRNGNAGMYLVGEEYDISDYNEDTGTYKVVKDSLTYDFSQLDDLLEHFKAANTLPYLSWCYIPTPLADNGKFNNLDNKVLNWKEVWEEIYYQYAKHYLDLDYRVGYHEIYNEPDLEMLKLWGVFDEDDQYFLNIDDFAPHGDPSLGCYPDMYEYGIKGILRANPDATVGGPAFALGEIGVEDWVGFFPRVKQKKLPLDFYSFHSYLDGETWFMNENDRAAGKKNELERVVDGLQSDAHFMKTQLHINEYSCLNNDNGAISGLNAPFNLYTGASNTLDAIFEAIDRTSIQLINWAQLLSVNNISNDPYGLIAPDGQPKAAFNAVRIYQDMPTWRYQAETSKDDGIRVVTSSDNQKISIAIWNTNSSLNEDGMTSKEGDREVRVNVLNPRFNAGTRRIYRIDKTHASYYNNTVTSELSAQNIKELQLDEDHTAWKGIVPSESVVYITINKNGREDFKGQKLNHFANDIKTSYYYEDRYRDLLGNREEYADFVDGRSGSYSLFNRNEWKMYLGLGDCLGDSSGNYRNQGHANGMVLADHIPLHFTANVETEKVFKNINKHSAFGIRVDFYDDQSRSYTNSVYFHNGVFTRFSNPNDQDLRLTGLDIYPWGTKSYADQECQCNGYSWDIDLSLYAPLGWEKGSRKAAISFDMRNTGAHSRATIQLIAK